MIDRIGKWKIIPLQTGKFWLDGGAMMGSVPKVLWEKEHVPDSFNRIELGLRSLLLDDGERRIIIETGLGNKFDSSFSDMFCINQHESPIDNALEEIGYSNTDITDVIITHLHFDHAGGATKKIDNQIYPCFPNAIYTISKSNWNAATNPSPRDRASYLMENFQPLMEAGVVNLINDNTFIYDSIRSYSVNGHTGGQQLILIEDEFNTLCFCSDLIPLQSHLRLPWIMGYDLNAELTLKEKKKFLDLASDNRWLLYFYHDPKYIAVRISKGIKYYDTIEEYIEQN